MIKNHIKTFVLLSILTALLLAAGQFFGGIAGLVIAGIIVIAMNFVSYFWSDKIVLKMYKAKPADKNSKLYKLVEEVAQKAGIPTPKVYEIPSQQANAFATGRNPKHSAVAATSNIINILEEDELKGVLAHEISHIKNRDILIQTIAAAIAGIISYLAVMARFSAIFGGMSGEDDNAGGLVGLLALSIITPIMATIVQLAISRSREFMADESGAKIIGSGEPLARALHKIHHSTKRSPIDFGSPSTSSLFIANPFKSSTWTSLLSTHPPMEKRIARLKKF